MIIYFCILCSILVVVGYSGAGIMFPIMLFPAYYYNIRAFCMIMSNWSSKRRYQERSDEEARVETENNEKIKNEKSKKKVEEFFNDVG
jgi:hypothetical protein